MRVKVIIHDRGKSLELGPDAPEAAELISRCEDQLRTADGMLRLAVTSRRIEEIRRSVKAVEILYSKPAAFTLSHSGRKVEVQRLMIPLTGELAGEVTTIFHGKEAYGAGPLRNRRGTAEIQQVVERLAGS